ncbi:MC152.1 [Molluscum contagiosum virus subtype 1]|uniref:MC152.1R n=1 Tax=Molluscum contagiosum virus TaxID=10279 RepID=A0A858A4N0_9POXV|nr:MC152.1 [Molluscum contagiosum virus subtype 1]AYO88650.1 MC152.1 [Molluscum contagiosum virus subtype 1]AYO89004.1 MC152.1 [Molluscum contagiosum virus subtype 1]QHW17960.1 MC152.1R [Molluscum contagiosum virus]QHW18139.1 MC152.1R [Molluscum contagiosum virus]
MAITIESTLAERVLRSEPMDSLLRMLSEVVILRSPVFQMFCMLYIEIESCPGYDVSTISCERVDTACRACAYRKHGTARNAGGRALQCLCFFFACTRLWQKCASESTQCKGINGATDTARGHRNKAKSAIGAPRREARVSLPKDREWRARLATVVESVQCLFSRAFCGPRFARRAKVNKHASWEQRHGATHVPLLRAPAVLRASAAALPGAARELRAPATGARWCVSRAQDGSGQRSLRAGAAAVRAARGPLYAVVLAQLRQRCALLALCYLFHTQARRLRLAPSRFRILARR